MKKIILLFGLFTQFLFTISSSVPSQDFNERYLMRSYHFYISNPKQETYYNFGRWVVGYYINYPLDCLNLLERFRSNWVFKVLFCRALAERGKHIDPKMATPGYYPKILKWISFVVRGLLLNCSRLTFNTDLDFAEHVSVLVKIAEKTLYELKLQGAKGKLIERFDDQVAIWKFLIFNISIDFPHGPDGFYSVFRALDEIIFIVKSGSATSTYSSSLPKLYSLFCVYLYRIYDDNRNIIFSLNHRHKEIIVYFMMNLSKSYRYLLDEIFPNYLPIRFEKLYGTGTLQLDPIVRLVESYNPRAYGIVRWLFEGIISSFSELFVPLMIASRTFILTRSGQLGRLLNLNFLLKGKRQKV